MMVHVQDGINSLVVTNDTFRGFFINIMFITNIAIDITNNMCSLWS
jgi:hypothetical protein